MNGWPITDWSNQPDWSSIANGRAFFGAYNDRRRAVGQYAQWTPQVGDEAARVSFWALMQQWLQDNCGSFIQSHEIDGSPRDVNFYHNKDNFDFWTWENLCKSAGLWLDGTHYGWRQATNWPADWTDLGDAAYAWRNVQPGDLVGPWNFADVQQILNRLIWTRNSTVALSDSKGTGPIQVGAASYAAALVAMSAAWPLTYDVAVMNHSPFAYYYCFLFDGRVYATACVCASKFSVGVPNFGITPEVDFYVRGQRAWAGFDHDAYNAAHWNGLGLEGKLSRMATVAGAGTVSSGWLHDNPGLPPAALDPTLNGDPNWQEFTTDGDNNHDSIIRWNVAGGFSQY